MLSDSLVALLLTTFLVSIVGGLASGILRFQAHDAEASDLDEVLAPFVAAAVAEDCAMAAARPEPDPLIPSTALTSGEAICRQRDALSLRGNWSDWVMADPAADFEVRVRDYYAFQNPNDCRWENNRSKNEAFEPTPRPVRDIQSRATGSHIRKNLTVTGPALPATAFWMAWPLTPDPARVVEDSVDMTGWDWSWAPRVSTPTATGQIAATVGPLGDEVQKVRPRDPDMPRGCAVVVSTLAGQGIRDQRLNNVDMPCDGLGSHQVGGLEADQWQLLSTYRVDFVGEERRVGWLPAGTLVLRIVPCTPVVLGNPIF